MHPQHGHEHGDGEQTRDFLYVDDLCDAVVAAIVHPDGSATCADAGCGAHIPTTTEGD